MSDRTGTDRLVAGRRAAGRAESADSSVADPALRQLQTAVGNDGLRMQLNQGRADRSTMLMHIVDRLHVMQELQSRESGLLDRGSSFEWWREIGRGNATVPDPNRWHAAAGIYKNAMDALCAGDLGRGRQLLESAMTQEDHAVQAMTSLVDTSQLDFETRPDASALDGLVAVGQIEPCGQPEGADVADKILQVTAEIPEIPHMRITKKPWWAEEEEDEEEAKPEGDDAGGS